MHPVLTESGKISFIIRRIEKEYFVLGDNLAASEDSRSEVIGPVKESEIMGIPWFCIYPFTDMGIVR